MPLFVDSRELPNVGVFVARSDSVPRLSNVPLRWRIVVAFAAIYLIWGSTYLAIRFAIESIPPYLMGGARFLIAGGVLYAVLRWRGVKAPSRRQWRAALIVGGVQDRVALSPGLAFLLVIAVALIGVVVQAGLRGRGRLVATDLTNEASQAQRAWIEKYFKVPYSLRPILTERMPNLHLSDAEIKTLVDYMEQVFVTDSLEHDITVNDAAVAKGKLLYEERYGCQGCHQINSKGGYVGPPLDKVASRLQPGWMFHWLKNPQAFKPESIEPNNNLSDQDAEALTAYLMTLR